MCCSIMSQSGFFVALAAYKCYLDSYTIGFICSKYFLGPITQIGFKKNPEFSLTPLHIYPNFR